MNATFGHLDWDAIYLTCFGVGLALSSIAFVGGFLHLNMGHLKLGGHGHVLSKTGSHGHAAGHMSPINGFTLVAFLCWFGGAGYLLAHGHVFTWAMVLGFAIPPGGVGEMLYSQNGARRSIPIAAEDGAAIGRNAEVVALRYARGIAYVRRWDEMQQLLMGDEPAAHSTDLSND